MRLKEWILLVFIIGTGLFFHFREELFDRIEESIIINDLRKEYLFTETKEISPPFPSLINVKNKHGKIRIIGKDLNKIKICLKKRIYTKSQKKANKIGEKLKIDIIQNKEKLVISSNRDEFRKKIKTDFEIFLPKTVSLKVHNSYGTVLVENISGDVSIENSHGKIFAREIGGELSAVNAYASLNVEGVYNDCYLKNKHAPINVMNVKGKVKMEQKYGIITLGNIEGETIVFAPHSELIANKIGKTIKIENSYNKIFLRNIEKAIIKGHHSSVEIKDANGVKVENNYGKVYISNVRGDLKISGKYLLINASNISGDRIEISSSYRDTKLIDFLGDLNISLSHGDLLLKPRHLISDIKVLASYSNIKFFWPKGEKIPFEGKVKYGKIKADFPLPLKFYRENGIVYIKAFEHIKDKPKIFISTSYGDLYLKEGAFN